MELRVLEAFSGFDLGGAERAFLSRLEHVGHGIETLLLPGINPNADLLSEAVHLGATPLASGPASSIDLLHVIEYHRPDVIIVHSPRETIRYLARVQPRTEIPIVVVAHSTVLSDSGVRSAALAPLMRHFAPRARLHAAVSRPVAAGPWCAGAARVEVCPLGSKVSLSASGSVAQWPQGTELRLLAISRLTRPKNLRRLIHVVKSERELLLRSRAHIAVVGEGPEKNALAQQIRQERLEDLVSLHPMTQQPSDWIASADTLLVASTAEGGPLTAYEAALCGTRIAGTPVGILPELIALDNGSFVVGGTSPSYLGLLIREAVRRGPCSSEERAERATRGTNWSADHCATHFYQLISGVT